MKTAKFYGTIKDGSLELDRLALFLEYIKTWKEGERVEMTIKQESQDKTAEQLAYYFSCVVQPLADCLGYTKTEMDGVLCRQLLTENPGTKKEFVRSKSNLSRAELAAFIDGAIMLAAQGGVIVCPPNKYWRLNQ